MTDPTPRSAMPGIAWPALAAPDGAALMAMLYQLDHSQWLPPEALRRRQYGQLGVLLRHAHATVPFYRRRLDEAGIDVQAPLDDATWARLPRLTRQDIQSAGSEIHSTAPPPAHGRLHSISTSGSTGMPVTTLGTHLTRFFWLAFTMRDQAWHGFDLGGKLAAIRHLGKGKAAYPDGAVARSWGPAVEPIYKTGPGLLLDIATPVAQQVEWLRRRDPDYLITYPSNLMSLLAYCRDHEVRLKNLKFVETLAEILHPEVRAACREVWGLKVVDMYSSQEMGYIALQCPEHEHYHVQSENVLVEVLDEAGRPCRPGETGRLVATPLHNFAMPLIRYDIGDRAVAGGPCPCGRGLPVLERVLGRARNMLVMPDGTRHWPYFGGDKFAAVAPVSQYQIIQKSLEALEVRIVAVRPLDDKDESRLREVIEAEAGKGFRISFVYVDEIPRSKGGKFEDFRSEVAS